MALPNLLLIVIDSARADRLSCYGYGYPTTPNIDAIAAEGVVFKSAWAESSWTLPMCFTMLTGLAPREHRAETHRTLPAEMPTLQEALGRAGYHTVLASGNQFIGVHTGLQRGFDHHYMPLHVFRMTKPLTKYLFRWFGWSDAGGQSLSSHFLAHLKQAPQPWFALLWYNDVHHPFVGKQPFTQRFCRESFSLGRRISLMRRMRHMQELGATATKEDLEDVTGLYDGALAYTDSLIGQVREGLQRGGTWEDTVVMVTADHGEMLGEKGLMSHGRPAGMYRPLIRVPLVVRGPGLACEGVETDALVQLADVTHTLAALGGVSEALAPSAAECTNLLSAAMGQGRSYALSERQGFPAHRLRRAQRRNPHFDFQPHVPHITAVMQDDWKLIHKGAGSHELHNLRNDPAEEDNVIEAHQERAAKLSQMVLDWHTRTRPHPSTGGLVPEIDPEVQKRLEGLGYF